MDILKKSLENAPIINKGKYQYIIHPLTDGIPEIKPNLLEEVTNKMFNIIILLLRNFIMIVLGLIKQFLIIFLYL